MGSRRMLTPVGKPWIRPHDGTTPDDGMAFVQRDLDDADNALSGGRWEAAGFPSIQALEKSLKALARKHTTYGDLNGRPYSEMNGLTYAQLESGGDQANVHDLGALVDLLRTWHHDAFTLFEPDFDWIDQAKLYERLRYPNLAVAGAPRTTVFGEAEARRLRALASDVVAAVRARL